MDEIDQPPIGLTSSTRTGVEQAVEALGGAIKVEKPNRLPESKNFQFLTFTDFQQTTDPQTKKKVRSHVMHRVHQTIRSGGRTRKEGVVVLDISSLLGGLQSPLVPAPRALGAGRLNPFAKYPITMNARTLQLFDHLQGPFCPVFKTMSSIGFYQTLSDPDGFRQILCTSACHMEVLRGTVSEPSDAIVLSTQALQSVNRRLKDPAESRSDGMLAAVLAFCCHSVMFRDRKASVAHFNGLEQIVQLRGGLESLNSSPVLRMMLFWADTNIAFTEDRSPRYPTPNDLLSAFILEHPAQITIPIHLVEACLTDDIASVMRDLHGQNQLLVEQVYPRSGWTDGVFANLNLMPVLYKFLAIRYDDIGQDPVLIRHAAYRSSAVLYLTAIRVQFNIRFSEEVHVRNLQAALSTMEKLNIDCDLSVLVWLLVIGGTQSITYHEHAWFLSKLAHVVTMMNYASWEQVMHHVRKMLWADGLSQEACEVLRGEVSAEASKSYHHIFT